MLNEREAGLQFAGSTGTGDSQQEVVGVADDTAIVQIFGVLHNKIQNWRQNRNWAADFAKRNKRTDRYSDRLCQELFMERPGYQPQGLAPVFRRLPVRNRG